MKTIVTVKRDIDGARRIYQLPNGQSLAEGAKVMVEYRDGRTAATVIMRSVEIDDEITRFFVTAPMKRVISVITENTLDWEDPQDTAESPTEA